MSAAKRLRIARIVTASALSPRSQWFSYAPLGRKLTRRERWRGSRAHRILTIPVTTMRAPLELGD